MRTFMTFSALTVFLCSATAAFSAITLKSSMALGTVGGSVQKVVDTKNGVLPESHPLYHHYKHRYHTSTKSSRGRRR
jgi:hypothetical protein